MLCRIEEGDHIITKDGHWVVHSVFTATNGQEHLIEIQSLRDLPGYARGQQYKKCVVPLALIDACQVYTPRVQIAVVADAS